MYTPEVRERIERELAQAAQARSAGNEGQARVCARRAAGAALGAFFYHNGYPSNSSSVIDQISQARKLPGMPENVLEVLDHLLTRVNPEYELPLPVDLVSETHWLAAELERLSSPGAATPGEVE